MRPTSTIIIDMTIENTGLSMKKSDFMSVISVKINQPWTEFGQTLSFAIPYLVRTSGFHPVCELVVAFYYDLFSR